MYCDDMELSEGHGAAWCKIRSVLNPNYPTLFSSDEGGIKTRPVTTHAFFVYYENADLVYNVIRMRQLSKQTLHELPPNDNS